MPKLDSIESFAVEKNKNQQKTDSSGLLYLSGLGPVLEKNPAELAGDGIWPGISDGGGSGGADLAGAAAD